MTDRTSPAVTRVLGRLVALGKRIEEQGENWKAQCPAHDDERPSLAVKCDKDDGKALLKCWAGCSQDQVIGALGLGIKGLFLTRDELREWWGGGGSQPANGPNTSTVDEPGRKANNLGASLRGVQVHNEDAAGDQEERTSTASEEQDQGLTLDAYAKAKGLPKDFLQQLNLSTIYVDSTPVVSIPYKDESGRAVAVQYRRALQRGQHEDGRFTWSRKGTTLILYGLWRLDQMRQSSVIVLVEGASDCQTLWFYDLSALGLPGASSWREAWASVFDGFETIYIVLEADRGGQAVLDWVTKSSIRHRVKFISLEFLNSPAAPIKDPSDLYIRRPSEFRECWEEALRRAVPWEELHRQQTLQQVSTLYRDIKNLLEAPDLLDRVKQTFKAMGYVGDAAPPTLVFLAMTSRLLRRPMNAACVGPSSVGKNETVNAAKALTPPEDVYEINAASPMALVYNDASFERKIVIFSEMDSIPEDGPAGSAIRSLAATNELAYDVVEKNPKTGRYETRHIVKTGPTVLITTGIRSPGQQLGTRMLEIPVSDAPDQTWAILARQALEVSGHAPAAPDLRPLIDLQRWLALQPTRAHIPFAAELLAELKARLRTPPVRLRRDFTQLQICIAVIALLYQCQRQRGPDGALQATLDDYEEARVLLEPIFAAISTEGVTKAVRETVEEITPDEEISESQLARRLQLSKTATHERVKRALAGGWLVNREERKGYAAKLARGTPLPEDRPILPTKAELMRDAISENPDDDAEDGLDVAPETGRLGERATGTDATMETSVGVQPGSSSAAKIDHSIDGQLNCDPVEESIDRSAVPVDKEGGTPPPPSPSSSMSQGDAEPADVLFSTVEVSGVEVPPYIYIKDGGEFERIRPRLLNARVLSIDTETSGKPSAPPWSSREAALDPYRNAVRLLQVADAQGVIIIDLHGCPVAALEPLMHGDRWLVGHNLVFDLASLHCAGLSLPSTHLFDTLLGARVLDADGHEKFAKRSYSLKDLAQRFLGVALDKTLQCSEWSGELTKDQQRYAALDAWVPLVLAKTLRQQLKAEGLWPTARLEGAVVPTIAWLELNGMPINAEQWALHTQALHAELGRILEELTREIGTTLNWNAHQQALPVLRARGHALDNYQIETLRALLPTDDPLIYRVLAFKEASTMVKTYTQDWLDAHVHPVTGRVHASYDSLGQTTGRMATRGPNMHGIPRKDGRTRSMFKAPPGDMLVKADYRQLHLRLAAGLAPDETLQAAFRAEKDPHTVTAAALFGVPEEAVTSEQRKVAKIVNFGILNGMTPSGLVRNAWKEGGLRWSLDEAQRYHDGWFQAYAGVQQWRDRYFEDFRPAKTAVYSPRRRRRARIFKETQILASILAATESDGLKLALVELFRTRIEVPTARLAALMHDEVVVECRDEDKEEVGSWLKRHLEAGMQEAVMGTVPTPVEVTYGATWAESNPVSLAREQTSEEGEAVTS